MCRATSPASVVGKPSPPAAAEDEMWLLCRALQADAPTTKAMAEVLEAAPSRREGC